MESTGNHRLNIDPGEDRAGTQAEKKAFSSKDAIAGSSSPGNREGICTSALKLDGQAGWGVNESSIHMALFIPDSRKTAQCPGQ